MHYVYAKMYHSSFGGVLADIYLKGVDSLVSRYVRYITKLIIIIIFCGTNLSTQ